MRWHGRAAAAVILTGWMLSVAALPQDPPGSRMGAPQPRPASLVPPAPPQVLPPVAAAQPARKDRRDPFVPPVSAATAGAVRCSGKACLVAEELLIRGVVRSPARNFAIVEDGAGRVYFLGENETVHGGVVERIAADGIVFRLQAAGRPAQHLLRKLAPVSEQP